MWIKDGMSSSCDGRRAVTSVSTVCVRDWTAASTSIFNVDNTHLLCNLAKYVIIYKEDIRL